MSVAAEISEKLGYEKPAKSKPLSDRSVNSGRFDTRVNVSFGEWEKIPRL